MKPKYVTVTELAEQTGMVISDVLKRLKDVEPVQRRVVFADGRESVRVANHYLLDESLALLGHA